MNNFLVVAAVTASFLCNALESRAFSGELTTYPAGLGACGKFTGDNDQGAAVSRDFFTSANPNNDPVCSKSVRVFVPQTGRTVVAPVVDSCGSCSRSDLDVTFASWNALGLGGEGRVAVEWEFV